MNKVLMQSMIKGSEVIFSRNKFGNVITFLYPYKISEEMLREVEKHILFLFNKRVTAFWKKGDKKDILDCQLDFDAKFPYTEHPLYGLIEVAK
ncbi:MAG: hypothetical protein NC222_06550 [Staphylococcus sp.]|nr:hypothetical protein [Staphylococcus sp.]